MSPFMFFMFCAVACMAPHWEKEISYTMGVICILVATLFAVGGLKP